ncbi:hypothetical protein AALB16_10050 [Lachnospiraceae bacterium 62-35]
MSGEMEKICGIWERFEKNHIKEKNEELFEWFYKVGLGCLKEKCEDWDKFTYEIQEDGITVTILTKEILLLGDFDKEILDVLSQTAICSIKADEKGWLVIELWFRGWCWKEKS